MRLLFLERNKTQLLYEHYGAVQKHGRRMFVSGIVYNCKKITIPYKLGHNIDTETSGRDLHLSFFLWRQLTFCPVQSNTSPSTHKIYFTASVKVVPKFRIFYVLGSVCRSLYKSLSEEFKCKQKSHLHTVNIPGYNYDKKLNKN